MFVLLGGLLIPLFQLDLLIFKIISITLLICMWHVLLYTFFYYFYY